MNINEKFNKINKKVEYLSFFEELTLHCNADLNVSEESEVVGKIWKVAISLINLNITQKFNNINKKWNI